MADLLGLGWIKLALIGVVLAALVAGATWYHHSVFSDGQAAQKLVDDKVIAQMKNDQQVADAKARDALDVANAALREKQKQLDETIYSITTQHHKELTDANNKNAALASDLNAGRLRLSIATTGSACNQTPGTTGAGSVTGNLGQGRTELVPETAAALVRIATDGDRSVRKLNACIDSYNAVKNLINSEAEK